MNLRHLVLTAALTGGAAETAPLCAQAATKPAAPPATEQAVAKERSLWDMLKRNDFRAFDGAVGGMTFAGATGVVPEWKPGLAEAFFKGCVLKSFALDSMQARARGADLVVLSYRATTDWTCGGTRMPSPTYETAVWQRQGNRLVALFGGSTPVAVK